MAEPHFWVKIWIDGHQVAEDKLILGSVATVGRKHVELVEQAQATGRKWLVEVTDPDLPLDQRHMRFGNDPEGMVEPTVLGPGGLMQAIMEESMRRYGL